MKALSAIMQSFYRSIGYILQPTRFTNQLSIRETLALYYKFLPIPIILILIVGMIGLLLAKQGYSYATFWSPQLTSATGFASSGSAYTTLFALICLSALMLTAFINAAIYHVVGKFVVRTWRGSFSKTFTAVVLGMLPVALLLFILSLPLANPPTRAVINSLFTIMYVWGGIVTWLSLATQHDTNKWRTLISYIIGTLFVIFTLTIYINIEITVSIWKEMLGSI
jgi:hypothetical protein